MQNMKNMHNRDAKNICIKQMHKEQVQKYSKDSKCAKCAKYAKMQNMLNVQQKMQRMQKVLKCKKDAKEMLNRCTAYNKQMHNRDANKICTKTDAKICKG